MKFRELGKTGIKLSAIGLGCMGMSFGYSDKHDTKDMIKVLHQAVDMGENFFDTAECYGPFTNEELLGQAFKDLNKEIYIATKFGFKFENGKSVGLTSHPDNIKRVCDESLKRLNRDVIDLFYQHRVDTTVPIEDVAGAVKELIEAGKVRAFGLSEANAETIRKAHAVCPVSAAQNEFSLWWKRPEKEIMPTLEELGITLVPYSPLGKGYLCGNFDKNTTFASDDFRSILPRFQKEMLEENYKIVELVKEIANSHNATPAQIALAWILHQKPYIIPIPGTTKAHRIQENLGAIDVELTKDELEKLNKISENWNNMGDRYPEHLEALTNK